MKRLLRCSTCGKIKPLTAFRTRLFKDRNKRVYKQYARKRCLVCYKNYRINVRRPIQKEKWKANKLLIMKTYGEGKCQCCGEKHLEFLTLDHVGGKKTRIALGHIGGVSGQPMYQRLIKNNFPHKDKLRVLCLNCNFSLGIIGYCPHRKVKIMV